MAVPDDLKQLAQLDVAYLSTTVLAEPFGGPTIIYRGRLHQALSGNWVFNTSTGQNGVAGIVLGTPGGNWVSGEDPQSGLQITISYSFMVSGGLPQPSEIYTLMSVIPADLAD